MCSCSNQMYTSESKYSKQLDKYVNFLEKLKLYYAYNNYFNDNKLNLQNETNKISHNIFYDLENTFRICNKNFKKDIEASNKFFYYENHNPFIEKENCGYQNNFNNIFQRSFYDKTNANTFSNYIIPSYNDFYELTNNTIKEKENRNGDNIKGITLNRKIEKFSLIQHNVKYETYENNKKIKNRKYSYLNSKKLLNKYFHISNNLKIKKKKKVARVIKKKKYKTTKEKKWNLSQNKCKISNEEKIKFLKKLSLNFSNNKKSNFNFFLFLNNLNNTKNIFYGKESRVEDFENTSSKSEYLGDDLNVMDDYEKINIISYDDLDFYKIKRKGKEYLKKRKLLINFENISKKFQVDGTLFYKNEILNVLNFHKKIYIKKEGKKKKKHKKINEKYKKENTLEFSSKITKLKKPKVLKIKNTNNFIFDQIENLKSVRIKKLHKCLASKNLNTNNIGCNNKRNRNFYIIDYSNNLNIIKSNSKNNFNDDNLFLNALNIFLCNGVVRRSIDKIKRGNFEKDIAKEKKFYSDGELKKLNCNINKKNCRNFLFPNIAPLNSLSCSKNYYQKDIIDYRNSSTNINDKSYIEINKHNNSFRNLSSLHEENNRNKNGDKRNEDTNNINNNSIHLKSRNIDVLGNMYNTTTNNNNNIRSDNNSSEMKIFNENIYNDIEEKDPYNKNSVETGSILKRSENLEIVELLNVRKNCNKQKNDRCTIKSSGKNLNNSCYEYITSKKINEDVTDLKKNINEIYSEHLINQDENKFNRTCSTTCTSSCKSEIAQKNDFYNKQENLRIIKKFRKIDNEESDSKRSNYNKKDEIRIENNYTMNNIEKQKIFKDEKLKKLYSLNAYKENKNSNLKKYLEENNYLKIDSNCYENSSIFLCCDQEDSTKENNGIFNYTHVNNKKIVNEEKITSIKENDEETKYEEDNDNATLLFRSSNNKNSCRHILNEDNFNKMNKENYIINRNRENDNCVDLEENIEFYNEVKCSYNIIERKIKKKNIRNVGMKSKSKKKSWLKPKVYWCKKSCFFELKGTKGNEKIKEIKKEEIFLKKKCKNKCIDERNAKHTYETIHRQYKKCNNNINTSTNKNAEREIYEKLNDDSNEKMNHILYSNENKDIEEYRERSKKLIKENKDDIIVESIRENNGIKNNKKNEEYFNEISERNNNIYHIKGISNKLNDKYFNNIKNKNVGLRCFEKNRNNSKSVKKKNNTSNILSNFSFEINNQDKFYSRKFLSEDIRYFINCNESYHISKNKNSTDFCNELKGENYHKKEFLTIICNNKKNELSDVCNISLNKCKINHNQYYISKCKENEIVNNSSCNRENCDLRTNMENNINNYNEIIENIRLNNELTTNDFNNTIFNHEKNKIILYEKVNKECKHIYNTMPKIYSNNNFRINNSTEGNKIWNNETNLDIAYCVERNINAINFNRTNNSYIDTNTMNDVGVRDDPIINTDIYDKNKNNNICNKKCNIIKEERLNSIDINSTNIIDFDVANGNNTNVNTTNINYTYLGDIYNNMNTTNMNNNRNKKEIQNSINLLNIKNSNFKNIKKNITEEENFLNDDYKNIEKFVSHKNSSENGNNIIKNAKNNLINVETNSIFTCKYIPSPSTASKILDINNKINNIININNVNSWDLKNNTCHTVDNSKDNKVFRKLLSRNDNTMRDSTNNAYNIIYINNDSNIINNLSNINNIENVNNINQLYSINRTEGIDSDNINMGNNSENNEIQTSNNNYYLKNKFNYSTKEENIYKEEIDFNKDNMQLSKCDFEISNSYDKKTKENIEESSYENLEYDNKKNRNNNLIKEMYINNDEKSINTNRNNEYIGKINNPFVNKHILNNVYIKNSYRDEQIYNICENEKFKNDDIITKYENNEYYRACDNLSYSNYNINNFINSKKAYHLFNDSESKKNSIYHKKELSEEEEGQEGGQEMQMEMEMEKNKEKKELYFFNREKNKNIFIFDEKIKKENVNYIDTNKLQNGNLFNNKNMGDDNIAVHINTGKIENYNENLNFFSMKTDVIKGEQLDSVLIEKHVHNEFQIDKMRNNLDNENRMNEKLIKLNVSNYCENGLKNPSSMGTFQGIAECSEDNFFINENSEKKRNENIFILNENSYNSYSNDSSIKCTVQNISGCSDYSTKKKKYLNEKFQNNLKNEMDIHFSKGDPLKRDLIKTNLTNESFTNDFYNSNSHNNLNSFFNYESQNNLVSSFSYSSQNNLKNIYNYEHEQPNKLSNSFNCELKNNLDNSFELQEDFPSSFNDNVSNNLNSTLNNNSTNNLSNSFNDNSSNNLNSSFNDNSINNLNSFSDSSTNRLDNHYNDNLSNNMENFFNDSSSNTMNNHYNNNSTNILNNHYNDNPSNHLNNSYNDNSSNIMNNYFNYNSENSLNNQFNDNSTNSLNNNFNDNSTNSLNNQFNDNPTNSLNNQFNDNPTNSLNNKFNDNSTNSLNNQFNDNSVNSLNNSLNDNSVNSLNNNFNDNSTNSMNNQFNDNSSNILNNSLNDDNSLNSLNNSFNDNSSINLNSSFNIESQNDFLIEWYPGFDIPIGTNGRAILRKALHQKRMTNVKKCDELLSSNNLYPTSRSTFGDMKIRDLYRAAYILGVWNVAEKYCLLACERNGYKKEWIYMLKKNGIKITVKALKEIRNNHILNNKKLGNLNKKKKNSKNDTCKKITDTISKEDLEKNSDECNNFLKSLSNIAHNTNSDTRDATIPVNLLSKSNSMNEGFPLNKLEEYNYVSLINNKKEDNLTNSESHTILQNETENVNVNMSSAKYKRKYKKNKNKENINKKIDQTTNSSTIISEYFKNPNVFSSSKVNNQNNQNINNTPNSNNFSMDNINNLNLYHSIKSSFPNNLDNSINNKMCGQLNINKSMNLINTNLLRRNFYNTNKNLLYEKNKDNLKNYNAYYSKNDVTITNNNNIYYEHNHFNNLNYIKHKNINENLGNTDNCRINMVNNIMIPNHIPPNNFILNSQSGNMNGNIYKDNLFNNILPNISFNNYNQNFKNSISEENQIKLDTDNLSTNKNNFIYPIITINNSNNMYNINHNLNIPNNENRSNLSNSNNCEYLQKLQDVQLSHENNYMFKHNSNKYLYNFN